MARKKSYKLEPVYQADLKQTLYERYPGCIVQKEDPSEHLGIPDLLILYKDRWATLEVKISEKAHHQPGQDRYVEQMNDMSFSRFIYPENEEEVLSELDGYFKKPKRVRRKKNAMEST